jgi:hypothetical protein
MSRDFSLHQDLDGGLAGDYFRTTCNPRHARLQLLERRHDLALRCGTPSSSELPVLTRDVLLYLQLDQEHLQTLPGTTQRLGSEDGDVACTSREFS